MAASAAAVPTRVRPQSKADEIERKIPASPAASASVPAKPSNPQPAPQKPQSVPAYTPTAQKKSGCCLIPFTLALVAAAGILVLIF